MEALNRTLVPEIRPVPAKKMPECEREILANGAELVVIDGGNQPVSRLSVSWPVGRLDVDGRAAYNLMRQMITEGTSRHDGGEIADMFETCGAWVSVDARIHSTILTLYMLNHTAGELLPMIKEIVTDAQFPEETLCALREKFAASVELEYKKPKILARMNSTAIVYGEHHPQNQYNTAQDYREVERESLVAMYDRLIRSTMPTIYLSGRIDSAVKEAVRKNLGSVAFGQNGVGRRIVAPSAACRPAERHTEMTDSMQTALCITLPVIQGDHPDYEMLRVAVFALGGYFGSRLMSNIREEKGYTYGINASMIQTLEGTFCEIACETANEYVEDVKREVRREIERLAGEEMEADELEIIKNTMTTNVVAMFDSPFTIMDYQMRKDLLGAMETDVDKRMEAIAAVTAGDIAEAARNYLLEAPWLVASAGGTGASEGGVDADAERG